MAAAKKTKRPPSTKSKKSEKSKRPPSKFWITFDAATGKTQGAFIARGEAKDAADLAEGLDVAGPYVLSERVAH